MKYIISCKFNMDTACVETLLSDGSMISIDCTAVENGIADNRCQRADLDWLIYNRPMEYAQLILSGKMEQYLQGSPNHTIE